jgi:hypothetical protein
MQGSIERVRAVLRGHTPDRPPLYDLLRNDAVIEHFTGQKLTVENGAELVFKAYAPAVDATRPYVRPPSREQTITRPDGRREERFRWTSWLEPVRYADSDAWAAAKRAELDAWDPTWNDRKQAGIDQALASAAEHRRKLGEVFFFPSAPGGLVMGLYTEIGFEQFCYYLADFPDLVDELLERRTVDAVNWIDHLPDDHGLEGVFVGDDIAFNTGPLLSPAWFEKHYFHRLHRVCAAYHAKGIKVLFHSDGDLNLVLAGLVEAGIDGLNPIEVLAHMDVGDIHRRYPHLFMAGGIDVSQLLPFGSPQQVKDAVRRSLDAAEGRLMVGSSTELNNDVPLANYLALRQAVMGK